jgi:hypothetical protein
MAICVKESFGVRQDGGKEKREKFPKWQEQGSWVPKTVLALARWLKPAFVRAANRALL